MPTPRVPEHQPPQPPLRFPECPRCKVQMRLVVILPHLWFRNLDNRLFACHCGERISEVVARPG